MPLRSRARVGRKTISLAKSVSVIDNIPAPTGGWNALDALSDMPKKDAVFLDNWYPRQTDCKIRGGYTTFATGLGAAVETLMTHRNPNGTETMFGAAGTNVYDVSGSGAVGGASISSMSNARWESVNFGTSGGHFLYIVNGADDPRYYDGSSWTVPSITASGLTKANFDGVAVFKRALFFTEKDKLGFWYFPVVTISGAIKYFDLGPQCKKGGHLVAIGSWSRDGGIGPDDYAVFITSEGEVLVYAGTDPDSASTWAIIGVYDVGKPIGKRCIEKLGTELVIITENGAGPISHVVLNSQASQKVFVTNKIINAFTQAVIDHRTNFGWQPIFYPRENMLIFNIPIVENGESHQYVSNTTTGAWCRFKGQNANCFGIQNGDLYFGGNGSTFKADNGLNDAGADIETDAQTAFNRLGKENQLKQMHMARAFISVDAEVSVAMGIAVDYGIAPIFDVPTYNVPVTSTWDEAIWDEATWSDVETINNDWHTIGGLGYSVSIRMKTVSNDVKLRWFDNNILWEPASGKF